MSAGATSAGSMAAGTPPGTLAGQARARGGQPQPEAGEGLSEAKLGAVMVVPALIMMIVVALYPVISAIWLSLHRYNVKVPDDYAFVGLSNYFRILGAERWWESMATTLTFTFASVAVEFTIGLGMALVMNKAFGAWTGAIRVAVLIPWATITVVTALAWKWIFTPDLSLNMVNAFLGPFLGADACMLCGKYTSIAAMVFADVWKTAPFIALLLLAGLQSIDAEMYEAADVDGATAWTKFIQITIPCLKPAILVALLFRTLDAFRMFDLAYVMTGGANGTETVSVLAYDHLIRKLNMGLGSAMATLIFIITLGIALFYVKVLGANAKRE